MQHHSRRTVSNVTPAVTTQYLYDESGHVIAETTSAAVTTREYVWLGDLPVAVIDAVNTATPVIYYVHADHLMRPLKMTTSTGAVVWDAVWKPFGETFSITAAPKLDLGFPGQWTQSESGLAWNWHRHYDPTTGRYTKPDPLRFVDGPAVYGYVGGNPLNKIDKNGLSGGGTPGNNGAQNKQINDICTKLGLNKKQRRALHEEITGLNLGYQEILSIAKDMFP